MSHYKTLGIEKNASADEVKKAFRKLAKEFHPDTNPNKGAENKFKEINAAYEVLSDPEKRKAYDLEGEPRVNRGFGGFEDFFREMGFDFGFPTNHKIKTKQDVRADLHLNIEDGFKGTKMKIEYRALRICSACKKEQEASRCTSCHGTGMQTRRHFNVVQRMSCQPCSGMGYKKRISCQKCHGGLYTEESITHNLDIPKGVKTGQLLKVTGGGQEGIDGIGDLIVQVVISNSKNLRLVKDDLYQRIPISVIELVTGKEVSISLPDGRKVNVVIPPGTQVNGVIKMPGQGYPIANIYGNLFVDFDPFVPALNQTSIDSIKQATQ